MRGIIRTMRLAGEFYSVAAFTGIAGSVQIHCGLDFLSERS